MGEGVNIMPQIPIDVARAASGRRFPPVPTYRNTNLSRVGLQAGASGERTTRPTTACGNTETRGKRAGPALNQGSRLQG